MHTGETSERDGDYFGPAVNRAARLMAVAHGGQVLCSQSTAALAGDVAPIRSLGEHRLRDLAAAEQVFQVGDGEFPPLRSVDAVPTNLPTVRTELIGRTDDVTALMGLVERERLVTLTGVGGVGKTRLALGVAAAVAAGFTDGCWLVELAPVADGDEVVKTVAAALRSPTTTADALVGYLADRRVMIVLDNCEHVLDAAADLVDAILATAPDVHVLVTSREPLGLEGEQVRRVQSLTLPPGDAAPDEARSAAAVRLFTERATAVADGFTVDAGNVAAVIEICRHLDGIPLAIELAAARVRAMPPAEIARRLDERFRLLAGGSRRSQERHRTLLATVSWSHDLLTEDERVVFRRLAVFPASFDLAAAEAVVDEADMDVVECVLRLVDRSLVVYEPGPGRYRLLETLRQYGADRLADAGETEQIRERHARYFFALVDRVGPALDDARFFDAQATLMIELDNLRATADWCVEAGWWVELAGMCPRLWNLLGQGATVDQAAWYEHLIEHGAALDDQVVADLLGELAYLQVLSFGNYAAATELSERCRNLADEKHLQPPHMAWLATAMVATYTGDNTAAVRAGDRALAAAEARPDERIAVTARVTVIALCSLTAALAGLGEFDRSVEVATHAMHEAELTGHPLLIGAVVITAAQSHLGMRAEPDFAAGLEILTRHADGLNGADVNDMWLDIVWGTAQLELDAPGAVVRFARAARLADRLNAQHVLDIALRYLAILAADFGLTEHARALVAYTEANLRPYRIDNPNQAWIAARLDRALAGIPEGGPTPTIHRGEVLQRIAEIETAFTKHEPTAHAPSD